MKLVRTQIYLDPEVKEALQWYAQEQGTTLAQLIREEAKELVETKEIKKKRIKGKTIYKAHPLAELIGIGKGSRDASINVDEIYEDD